MVAEITTSYPTSPAGNSFNSGAHSGSHLLGVFTQLELVHTTVLSQHALGLNL